MKLPEGIGFVAEDFFENGEMAGVISMEGRIHAERIANAKLPALFEAWVRRDGVKIWKCYPMGEWWTEPTENDTHQAYLMLPTEIEKRNAKLFSTNRNDGTKN